MDEKYVDRLTVLKELCESPGKELFIARQKDTGTEGPVRVNEAGIIQICIEWEYVPVNLTYYEEFRRIQKEPVLPTNDQLVEELLSEGNSRKFWYKLLSIIDTKIDEAIAEVGSRYE